MRVAMLTPMAPGSAIADVMMQAVPTLTERWAVEVWCPSEELYRPCPVQLRPFELPVPEVVAELTSYDLVLYVLGDAPWHSRILPLARQVPGLVVMHDASLTNLVRRSAVEQGDLDMLAERVAVEYGDEPARVLLDGRVDGSSDGWLRYCSGVPLDDVATEGSLGVVVHSAWHASRMDGLTFGEVSVAPLPVPTRRVAHAPQFDQSNSSAPNLGVDDLLIVTVGGVNANRRVDRLIEAVAEVGRPNVHLWAVGPVVESDRQDLERLADGAGLGARFQLLGAVSDELLAQVLERADVGAALRDPVLEGQSASLLTQMLSGVPVVVLDHAHYSELPDSVVVKASPTDPGDLANRLEWLLEDPSRRDTIGFGGAEHVRAHRTGEAYGRALLAAGERALAARPIAHLSQDLAARVKRLGLHTSRVTIGAVAAHAEELFDLG